MEDAYVVDDQLPGLPGWALFAILDGHAGSVTAHRCAEPVMNPHSSKASNLAANCVQF
jgi:hypothetical protein